MTVNWMISGAFWYYIKYSAPSIACLTSMIQQLIFHDISRMCLLPFCPFYKIKLMVYIERESSG